MFPSPVVPGAAVAKLTRAEALVAIGIRKLLLALRETLPGRSPGDANAFHKILEEIKTMSDTFDTEMTQLRADVAAQSSVIASVTAAFRGLAAQLLTAEAAAKNAGATDAQIASVSQLRQDLEANTAALAAAVPANTPPASTTPATNTPASSDPAATAAPVQPASQG